ncbi:Protein of unknown function [Gryllus bimaculatus]|nr:Protein of unknown function [Gryllus bimaculatus]
MTHLLCFALNAGGNAVGEGALVAGAGGRRCKRGRRRGQRAAKRGRAAWMSGLWAAVGAVAGLAFVTVVGVCYFDRRSKWRDAQKTWDNTTDLPARPETLDDLLAPDIDVLIDCEIAPEHTQPATAAAADLPTPM